MKIKIKSDFRDYYDHAFCGSYETPDAVFQRQSTGGMSRSAMFAAFELAGLLTPRHGLVRDLVPALKAEYANYPKELWQMMQVVVHIDEQAHAGDGKVALSFDAAETQYPAAFAVEFLPTVAGVGAISYRHLRVGKRMFWLRYTSLDDWRANCGDVQIEFMCEAGSATPDTPFFDLSPMVAVDFLRIGNRMYAIDLNIAPGLRGTGIEKIMRSSAVLQAVDAWFTGDDTGIYGKSLSLQSPSQSA
ncbi:hypothetical protein SIL73_13125 [Acidithiobacillus thiooxidans]|uniref:hypothetical protein n=1 Tax=Acidithiobacillus thiooxidans TaxID=930 RepID=UPI0029C1AD36|nr:hypothetical protein [Acidithiobacillus thiooxidans]MDX5935632.1 hypothetical protein [Acidithiobacillus thiooxidans]